MCIAKNQFEVRSEGSGTKGQTKPGAKLLSLPELHSQRELDAVSVKPTASFFQNCLSAKVLERASNWVSWARRQPLDVSANISTRPRSI